MLTSELDIYDLAWVVRRMPAHVRSLMKRNGDRVVLAGGFIRSCIVNECASDVDLFGKSAEDCVTLVRYLAGLKGDTAPGSKEWEAKIHTTNNAHTIKGRLPVQFIHRWTFSNVAALVWSFDFTIARAAVWWEKDIDGGGSDRGEWKSAIDPRFYPDLAAKRLVYCDPEREEEAGGSMLRVLKFYQRGFRIPLDSLSAVMCRIFDSVHEDAIKARAEDDGISQSQARVAVVTSMLREVDPDVDPGHDAHIPALASLEARLRPDTATESEEG